MILGLIMLLYARRVSAALFSARFKRMTMDNLFPRISGLSRSRHPSTKVPALGRKGGTHHTEVSSNYKIAVCVSRACISCGVLWIAEKAATKPAK